MVEQWSLIGMRPKGGEPVYAGIYQLKSKEVRWLEVCDQANLTAI